MTNQNTSKKKVAISMSIFYLVILSLTQLIFSAESDYNFITSPFKVFVLIFASFISGISTAYGEAWINSRLNKSNTTKKHE